MNRVRPLIVVFEEIRRRMLQCRLNCRYTMFGGLYSVACTDALQLACIVIGLGVAAPFSLLHPAVSFEKNLVSREWLGEIRNEDLGEWVDGMLLLVFGGIPWQVERRSMITVLRTIYTRCLLARVRGKYRSYGLQRGKQKRSLLKQMPDMTLVPNYSLLCVAVIVYLLLVREKVNEYFYSHSGSQSTS